MSKLRLYIPKDLKSYENRVTDYFYQNPSGVEGEVTIEICAYKKISDDKMQILTLLKNNSSKDCMRGDYAIKLFKNFKEVHIEELLSNKIKKIPSMIALPYILTISNDDNFDINNYMANIEFKIKDNNFNELDQTNIYDDFNISAKTQEYKKINESFSVSDNENIEYIKNKIFNEMNTKISGIKKQYSYEIDNVIKNSMERMLEEVSNELLNNVEKSNNSKVDGNIENFNTQIFDKSNLITFKVERIVNLKKEYNLYVSIINNSDNIENLKGMNIKFFDSFEKILMVIEKEFMLDANSMKTIKLNINKKKIKKLKLEDCKFEIEKI